MSYKKYLKSVTLPQARLGIKTSDGTENSSIYNKYQNYLPEIYQGPSNRVERYAMYEGMQQDPSISWALDIIADFITQTDDETPFEIKYNDCDELPDSQTNLIQKTLKSWVSINDWKRRIFNTVKDALVYGDCVFIRDPETNVLQKVNIYDVVGVVVDELKNPTHYVIKNVDLNVPLKIATNAINDVTTQNLLNTISTNYSGDATNLISNNTATTLDPSNDLMTLPVDAKHIVHISLNVDNRLLYPFGLSTLESVYKIYIQKTLLQETVLLYRIKNATEKLVFNIPVGNIPKVKRKEYLERIRNEMYQRRMPAKNSDGVFNMIDVTYNSIPMCEDYYLPVDGDGVQPKIEKLAGGQNLGEINDLVLWENGLIRGLKVPQSWVSYGPNDSQRTVPTSLAQTYVQELRFYQYCKRLQAIIIDALDKEFKRYLNERGLLISEDAFYLSFNDPMNIIEMTKSEIAASNLNTFNTAVGSPYISKQFALKKYLKLTEAEYEENQRLLILENQERFKMMNIKLPTEDVKQVPGLRSIDIEDIPTALTDTISGLNNQGDMGGMPGGDLGGAPMGDMGGAPTASDLGTPNV